MPAYPGIDEYRRRVGTPGPILPHRAPRESIGEGIASLGQGIGAVVDVHQRLKEQDAAVSANSDLMAARSHWMTQLQERKTAAPAGAENFTRQLLEDFDKDSADRLKRAKTPRARQELEQRLGNVRLGLQQDAMQFEDGERVRFRGERLSQATDDAATAAKANPYDFPEIAAAQKSAIEQSGLDAESKSKLWESARSKLAVSSVLGMISQAPRETFKELQGQSDVFAVNALNSKERDVLLKVATEATHDAEVSGIVGQYSKNIVLGDRALEQLRKRTDISEEEKNAIAKDAQTGVTDLRNERKRTYVNELTSLETQIATDNVTEKTYADAATLYKNGALSPDEYAGLQSRAARAQKSQSESLASLSTLEASGDLPLSAHNADHVKIMDRAFKAAVKDEPVGSQGWQIIAMTMAQKHALLPDRANDWLNQTSKAKSAELVKSGAEFYGALQATKPEALSTVPADTRLMLESVNAMLKNGATPADAVETSRANIFEANKAKLEERHALYNQKVTGQEPLKKGNTSALTSFINQDFDVPGFNPDIGPWLKYDFDGQVEKYYSKSGDIELARKTAWDDLKRVYGVTEVNGNREMMPIPPERFGVNRKNIDADLDELLKAFPQSDGSKTSDIVIAPTAETLIQIGNMLNGEMIEPTYMLLNKSGQRIYGKDGKPLVYVLPHANEIIERDRKAREEAARISIEKSKARRAKMRDTTSQDLGLSPSGFPDR